MRKELPSEEQAERVTENGIGTDYNVFKEEIPSEIDWEFVNH